MKSQRPRRAQARRAEAAALAAPAFPIGTPTGSSWRELTLARITELRGLKEWLLKQPDRRDTGDREIAAAVDAHLRAAYDAAASAGGPRQRLADAWGGSAVARAASHLDGARAQLLEFAPAWYVRGQLPSLAAYINAHMHPNDVQCARIQQLLDSAGDELAQYERDEIASAFRDAATEARNELARVRSFRNILLVMAVVLAVAAGGMALLGSANPKLVRLCFSPETGVVCPTQQSAGAGPVTRVSEEATAGPLDVAVVELLGLLGAAVAAAASLRRIRGTSTPYSLPLALAVLKLPTGALTALLGLLLMRGEFVPGLTNLDSQAQILGWAIIFGSAQHLVTRVVDQRAETVLEAVGSREKSAGVAPVVAPASA